MVGRPSSTWLGANSRTAAGCVDGPHHDARIRGARRAPVTFRARGRLTGVLHEPIEDTRAWMIAFLMIALVMIVAGVGWLAFGPPIH